MFRSMKMRLCEAVEILRNKGLLFAINRFIYFNDEVVVVEKNLDELNIVDTSELSSIKIINVTREELKDSWLRLIGRSGYYRFLGYLNKGYNGIMLARGDDILGYCWYCTINNSKRPQNHGEIKLLGISHKERGAYVFSVFIKPEERGKSFGSCLIAATCRDLKRLGVRKVYAIIPTHNIISRNLFRKLHWQELKKIKVSQLVFYKFVVST